MILSDIKILTNKQTYESSTGLFVKHSILCKVNEHGNKEEQIERSLSYKCSCARSKCGCTHARIRSIKSGRGGNIFLVDITYTQNV